VGRIHSTLYPYPLDALTMGSNWRFLALPLLAIAAVLGPAPAAEPSRWAVLVGVDQYPAFGDDAGANLFGAENDARAMRDVLVQRYGFPESNVLLLLNEAATKAAIRSALTEWLPPRIGAGDLVVFYFAGHGSLAMDEDGDEEDGLDETLCPSDALPDSADNDILDDELGIWLGALQAGQVVAILDSCHSGTATRQIAGVRPRSLPRPLPTGARISRGPATGAAAIAVNRTGSDRIIEIAAAASDQASFETEFRLADGTGYHGGAFTTHLVRRLWQAPEGASYRELFLNTTVGLKADGFAQDPQLSGPAEGPAFFGPVPGPVLDGTGRGATEGLSGGRGAVLAVREVRGSTVLIDGGADRGIAAGAIVELESGGVVRITTVGERTAVGVLSRGRAAPRERGWLTRVAFPAPRLHIGTDDLEPGELATLADLLLPESQILLAAGGGANLHVVREHSGGLQLLGRDGAPRESGDAGAISDLRGVAQRLKHELALLRLMNLDNPLGALVAVDIADGRREFRIGDEIHFRVTTQRDGYLTLLDLGPDGRLTVLYPNPWMPAVRLAAGATVLVPGSGAAVFTIGAPPGLGLVRALITDEPLSEGFADPGGGPGAGLEGAGRLHDQLSRDAEGGWASGVALYRVLLPPP
jgi:hypothetical protein